MTKPLRVLTGLQPSGRLHLGNYLGAIRPMLAYQGKADLHFFIANLHSLTSVSDGKALKAMTLEAAVDLLALGIDPGQTVFWVQSDVPEVSELAWVLSCLTPMGLLERAVSFKEKVEKGLPATAGLFNYPLLMSADILMFQAQRVPVGKDQKQHLEIARDLAEKFNRQYGDVFTLPEPDITATVAVVPGTDGQKMSKSYGNTLPLFATEAEWKKAVMGIKTSSTPMGEPMPTEDCTVFTLFALLAGKSEQSEMKKLYERGAGYGEAKKRLLAKIVEVFGPYAKRRAELMSDIGFVEKVLGEGAQKARQTAMATLEKVRRVTGLSY